MEAKKLIKEVMMKTGYTLTKLASEISDTTGQKTSVQNLSNKINRNTFKAYELEQWLNIMGYELDYKRSISDDISDYLIPILYAYLDSDECSKVIPLLSDPSVPPRLKLDLRNKIVHNGISNIRTHIAEFILEADGFLNIDDYF